MSQPKRIVIALGGNAIKQAHERGTANQQFRHISKTARFIVKLMENEGENVSIVITHGNGPQVGNLAMQQDYAKKLVPAQPLHVLGAMTQGQIGYMLQLALQNMLTEKGMKDVYVASVINQVLVDKNDPELLGENASKPVGNFLTEKEAMRMRGEKGWIVKKVIPNGSKPWRRVVPSPEPVKNVEAPLIRRLVDSGAIVVASGGGGVPVVSDQSGRLSGVEAVIDKDLASEKLAEAVDANYLVILTDVEKVKLNFAKPDEQDIEKMTVAQANKFLAEGQFLRGSMEPKVKACVRFINWGGKEAIITSLEKVIEALNGKTGTHIVPSQ